MKIKNVSKGKPNPKFIGTTVQTVQIL